MLTKPFLLRYFDFFADRGLFQMLIPDDSSPISTTKGLSPPEKLARVMSPEEALAVQHEMRPVPQPRQSIQVMA